MAIIEVDGLARDFRAGRATIHAVRGVSLQVKAGEIVGFLGPNGAGKTTTLRMLTTLLRPTAGTARIAGADLLAEPAAVRRRIGYVAQSGGTDPSCRVREELQLQARLHRIDAAGARARAALLLDQMDLADVGDRLVKTLSGGQRRRLDVAVGLAPEPSVLFLDEPTTGLDPQSRNNLWEHIRRLRRERGTTIFLTTHYLDEADALCDRILVIDHGQIVAEDTPDGLKRRVSGDLVTVEVDGDPETGRALLAGLAGVREAAVLDNRTLRLTTDDGDAAVVEVIKALSGAGIAVRSLHLARPSLEDVFLTLTGRSLRDGAA
jgi:ABC-2 type transport system ATP-binding protein